MDTFDSKAISSIWYLADVICLLVVLFVVIRLTKSLYKNHIIKKVENDSNSNEIYPTPRVEETLPFTIDEHVQSIESSLVCIWDFLLNFSWQFSFLLWFRTNYLIHCMLIGWGGFWISIFTFLTTNCCIMFTYIYLFISIFTEVYIYNRCNNLA